MCWSAVAGIEHAQRGLGAPAKGRGSGCRQASVPVRTGASAGQACGLGKGEVSGAMDPPPGGRDGKGSWRPRVESDLPLAGQGVHPAGSRAGQNALSRRARALHNKCRGVQPRPRAHSTRRSKQRSCARRTRRRARTRKCTRALAHAHASVHRRGPGGSVQSCTCALPGAAGGILNTGNGCQ